MQVLIIRHGIAEDVNLFALTGQSDALRPLTEKGKKNMRRNVQGLKSVLPTIQRIMSSPLVRAQQTAVVLSEVYPEAQFETLPSLAPSDSATEILSHLQPYENTEHTIALVGHEPDLGKLACWLLSGQTGYWLPLKKGSACLLEFPDQVAAGQAELAWYLNPSHLRGLK